MGRKVIEILDEMHASGELVQLVASGLVSGSVVVWREIYHKYTEELEEVKSKMQAAENIANDFNISVRTVSYIRDRMEYF